MIALKTLKKILKPLASLYLTVPLLLLSMLLIYAGTTVQKQMSIQDVQKQYFHNWFAWVPLDPVLRPFAPAGTTKVPGGFWTVGGYTLIALLLANLLAAHSVRFKLAWKRSGIIAIHLGLILLLVGEVFASLWSVESVMQIDTGQTANYSSDIRHVELAVIDPSAGDHDNVTVIDSSALKPGAVIRSAALPFEIQVDDYFANSGVLGPRQPGGEEAISKATAGRNKSLRLVPEPKISGTEAERSDMASAFVTLRTGGQSLGTYCLTQWEMENPGLIGPESVTVDGKTYRLDLRFRRYYKPYTLTLLKFTHDRYPGTDEASNFASLVRIVDPSQHVDRTVRIWMNHPLSYQGETYYQQNFGNHDRTTVLQVTHNPSWLLPYIGLALGFAGMLFHFGMHLIGFLRRRSVAAAAPPVQRGPRPSARPKGARYNAPEPTLRSYTLEPQINRIGWIFAALGSAIVLLAFIGVCAAPPIVENGFELSEFGQLPVMAGGRVMPLDTLARTDLKILGGHETYHDADGNSHPAVRWLADAITHAAGFDEAKVIRVDLPDIVTQLGLPPDQKFYSFAQINESYPILRKQAEMADAAPEKQRDLYQRKVLELYQRWELCRNLGLTIGLMPVPPQKENESWAPLFDLQGSSLEIRPGGERFTAVLDAYRGGQPREFNLAVGEYHRWLAQTVPETTAKADYETFFNKAAPFFWSPIFYVLVFVLACCSWLGWRKALWGAAMGVLVATLAIHTFGLASRIYITGRGPVTNLYAAAVFIPWAAVVLALGLEWVFRNGLGAAMAALLGFASLLVAHYLGSDGDTMKPVVAVLATNFWLWTHVPCVTLGYASTFLAGVLGIAYVVLGLFTTLLEDESLRKALARMVYGTVCFAILFSFVGTILGGIWADYSWGRFWGWDPKENGAILIVLWNAIILHARWGGMVRERGFMLLAIGGNIVTAWSFFGTNLLGIGLHSYGFMDGAATGLIGWWGLQLLVVSLGLIPLRTWRSFRYKGQEKPAAAGAVH